MTLASLPKGASVFLDANTLVYHFQPHPTLGAACQQPMARIDNQEVFGFTSTHILTEVAHRLMMLEAASLPGWKPTKVKQRLLKQPAALQQLTRFQAAVDAVLRSRPNSHHRPGARFDGDGYQLGDRPSQQRRPSDCRHAGQRHRESRQPRRRLRPRAGHHPLRPGLISPARRPSARAMPGR
jgi:hypothetical protein